MQVKRRSLLLQLGAIAMVAGAAFGIPQRAEAQEGEVVVFAAASLKNALDAVNAEWQKAGGKPAKISYAASSALAKQIEQAAPAHVFISADLEWMDYLDKKSLIKAGSRTNLLGNRIVLVAPEGSKAANVDIKAGFDLAKVVGGGKLAMANVDSVPAGKYGKAALTKLGAWDGVSGNLAQAENVRAALLLVSRGEAAAGIVYQTDAAADPAVKIIGTFPADSHAPIIYPAALVAGAENKDAAKFLDFVKSEKAKTLFEKQGFTVLKQGS